MNRQPTRILLVLGVLAIFLLPAVVSATHVFDDVEDDNTFAADIEWMKDNKITIGCNPPLNTLYCPKDFVTREQMAAFMHRLGVNKVVFAATAVDSDTVDGKHADELGSLTGSISGSLAYTAVADTPAVVLTLTGFDVPADGGVVTIDGNVSATIEPAVGDDQAGLVWAEVNTGGACAGSALAPGGDGWFFVSTDHTLFDSTAALATEEIAAGTHRIDLCVIGIAPGALTQLESHLNVTWSPTTSAAGVASADVRTYQDVIAPYVGMFDE